MFFRGKCRQWHAGSRGETWIPLYRLNGKSNDMHKKQVSTTADIHSSQCNCELKHESAEYKWELFCPNKLKVWFSMCFDCLCFSKEIIPRESRSCWNSFTAGATASYCVKSTTKTSGLVSRNVMSQIIITLALWNAALQETHYDPRAQPGRYSPYL